MDLVRHQPLLDAARAGDVSAIERLLAVCQPDIRRYAQRNCLISDVDDAVQESLLVLSRKVGSLRAAAAFSSWLFAIVRRVRRGTGLAHADKEHIHHRLLAYGWSARRTVLVLYGITAILSLLALATADVTQR